MYALIQIWTKENPLLFSQSLPFGPFPILILFYFAFVGAYCPLAFLARRFKALPASINAH